MTPENEKAIRAAVPTPSHVKDALSGDEQLELKREAIRKAKARAAALSAPEEAAAAEH